MRPSSAFLYSLRPSSFPLFLSSLIPLLSIISSTTTHIPSLDANLINSYSWVVLDSWLAQVSYPAPSQKAATPTRYLHHLSIYILPYLLSQTTHVNTPAHQHARETLHLQLLQQKQDIRILPSASPATTHHLLVLAWSFYFYYHSGFIPSLFSLSSFIPNTLFSLSPASVLFYLNSPRPFISTIDKKQAKQSYTASPCPTVYVRNNLYHFFAIQQRSPWRFLGCQTPPNTADRRRGLLTLDSSHSESAL